MWALLDLLYVLPDQPNNFVFLLRPPLTNNSSRCFSGIGPKFLREKSSSEKKSPSHEERKWEGGQREGRSWYRPRSRHPSYLCQEPCFPEDVKQVTPTTSWDEWGQRSHGLNKINQDLNTWIKEQGWVLVKQSLVDLLRPSCGCTDPSHSLLPRPVCAKILS